MEKKLGEICEIKTGSQDTQDKNSEGKYPFFVRSNTVERIDKYLYDGEAILTSGDGVGVGKNFHYINGKFGFHQRVYSLRKFQKECYGKFIYSVFSEKFYRRVMRLSAKNSVDSVRMDMISKMPFYFPLLEEQKKIASFLFLIEERISTQSEIIEDYEEIKKGMMQQLFSQQLRFKYNNGADFPDWEEKRLGEVCEMTSSKRVYLSDYVDNGIPFYRGKEITKLKEGKTPSNILFISNERYQEYKLKYGVPKENDILITAVGTLGNVLRIKNDTPFYFKDGNLIWLKKITQKSSFLEKLIEYYTYELIKTSIGSTQKALTMIELRKLKFSFPCLEEQTKIANFLSSIDEKLEKEKQLLETYKQQKKYLLQNMFV